MRYVIGYPVEGGNQWYDINDTVENLPVVSIFAHLPYAQALAIDIARKLNAGEDVA